MKIAVCLSGQVRTAIEAAPNLIRFFGEYFQDIDFFIHTWDIIQYKPYASKDDDGVTNPSFRPDTYLGPKPIIHVTPELIESYKEIYKPLSMEVENYIHFKLGHINGHSRLRDHSSLFYSWRRSVMMCAKYCIENDVKYDMVVKLKPDLVFPPYKKFSTDVSNFQKNPNHFHVDNYCPVSDAFEDVYWVASMTNMMLAANFGDPTFDADVGLRKFLEFSGVEIKAIQQQGYAPLRPEALLHDPLTNFKEVYETDLYWYSYSPTGWVDYE